MYTIDYTRRGTRLIKRDGVVVGSLRCDDALAMTIGLALNPGARIVCSNSILTPDGDRPLGSSWEHAVDEPARIVCPNCRNGRGKCLGGNCANAYAGNPAPHAYRVDRDVEPLNVRHTRAPAFDVDTTVYERSHGRTPRGRGSWGFVFGRRDYSDVADVWFAPGSLTYGEALKLAKREARDRLESLIGVCP